MATKTRYRDISKQAWSDWLGDHRKKLPTFGVYTALGVISLGIQIAVKTWAVAIKQLPFVFVTSLGPPVIWAVITLVWKFYITPYHLLVGAEAERDKLKKELTDVQHWEELDAILYRYIELGEQLIGFTGNALAWDHVSEVHSRIQDWVGNTHIALDEVRPEWATQFHTDTHIKLEGLSVPVLCNIIQGFIDRLHQIRNRHEKRHPISKD